MASWPLYADKDRGWLDLYKSESNLNMIALECGYNIGSVNGSHISGITCHTSGADGFMAM